MSSRNIFASILMACLLTIGYGGAASVANAAPVGQALVAHQEIARTNVVPVGRRSRKPTVYVPFGPSYIFYDYPYYYSRGHYPTHIGPRYVYYGPSFYTEGYYPRYGRRCFRQERCAPYRGYKHDDDY